MSQGFISVTSFSPSKTIPSWGSGGAILTDDEYIYDFVKKWITHGKEKNTDVASMLGANSTLGTLEAAQLLSVFINHSERHQRRIAIANEYTVSISNSYVQPLPHRGIHTWHKFIIDCKNKRDEVMEIFNSNGIETKTFYQPIITDEKIYKDFPKTELTQSKYYSNNLLAIPCQSTLTDDEIKFISNVLKSIE